VEVDSLAYVSEVHAVSVFKVEVSRTIGGDTQQGDHMGLISLKNEGVGTQTGSKVIS
jgi:hypothetical protein